MGGGRGWGPGTPCPPLGPPSTLLPPHFQSKLVDGWRSLVTLDATLGADQASSPGGCNPPTPQFAHFGTLTCSIVSPWGSPRTPPARLPQSLAAQHPGAGGARPWGPIQLSPGQGLLSPPLPARCRDQLAITPAAAAASPEARSYLLHTIAPQPPVPQRLGTGSAPCSGLCSRSWDRAHPPPASCSLPQAERPEDGHNSSHGCSQGCSQAERPEDGHNSSYGCP